MTPPQSLPRDRAAGIRRRIMLCARSAASVCFVLVACLTCASGEGLGGDAAAQGGGAVVRLRSFAPGATARLEVAPAGRRSRLVATNLPRPDALTPDARAYVVWATGGTVRRLGVLRRREGGAGVFEFAHPAGLARYGVVVTAEINSDAARPAGAPVLATRALEVVPFQSSAARRADAGTRASSRSIDPAAARRERVATPRDSASGGDAAASRVGTEERARLCAGRGCAETNFDGEVRRALASSGARTLVLVPARGAGRRARGLARVASRNGAAYARLRLRHVPPPARFGASRHVLWAVTDEDGPVYIGSLPEAGINRAQTFVRAENVADPNFRLLVTAEPTNPAPRPAGRRVLLTFKGRRRSRKQ